MSKNMEVVPIEFINLVQQPIFLLDDHLHVQDFNLSAKKIFNIEKHDFFNQSFSLLCPDINLKNLKSHDIKLPFSHIGEKVLSWDFFVLENTQIGVQYILIGSFSEIKDNLTPSKNNIKSLVGSIHNEIAELSKNLTGQLINENKNTLEYVKNIYNYMENIIAEIPVSVYWMNKDHKYLGCSNSMARLLNLKSRQDIIGKTYADLYDKISASHYKKADTKVMNKAVSLTLEEPLYHQDGTMEVYLSKKVPLLDPDRNIIGLLGISVDITERKKMEEDLRLAKEKMEAANYIMTEFISNMGHILVTPFSTISGVATKLLYGYSDKYLELKPWFEELMQGCTEWDKVYNQIIKGTSISEMELKVESFSINKELHIITDIMKPAAGAKKLELIFQPFEHQDEDLIETDKLKFHLILIELISNAIHFTEKGQVLISVSKENCSFDIHVSDTGIGIPADKLDYIFEQYTMLSRSQKHGANFKGVGAGLFLAKQRARLLDARILTTSNLSKGSTFTLSIPIHPVKNIQ